ncbi:MAG: RagB/SusD family nutrient uptake outer membrane protein [Candidatus Pseudobacter hemicellulosilyticus]|uniref:RagB/SusD family nutrient uptake outer membrane protein n=1 Tax=Candidatus Pseudobacter hemicellulosilyticus TaxID=3121375 RepID=A0AAJ5WWC8_9BACT|nr:MAG: RagB/SusD family nutrient uptake outer membrane protein [Pseudobacter sp.]
MYQYLLRISLLLIVSLSCACSKLISIDPPVDQLVTEEVFANTASAEATVVGLYSRMVYPNNGNRILDGSLSLYGSLSADELEEPVSTSIYQPFQDNIIPITDGQNYTLWTTGYNGVFHANTILDNLARSGAVPPAIRQQLAAETKFLRALHFFYLVNCYGRVPLPVSGNYMANSLLTRSDTAAVYKQLITDLEEAYAVLGDATRSGYRIYASKWVAAALLARVYLYLGQWEEAIRWSSLVLDSKSFPLSPLTEVFRPNSSETLLQFVPANTVNFNTREGNWFIPATAGQVPLFAFTTQMENAFEAGDLRLQQWASFMEKDGRRYYYPFKYKVQNAATGSSKTEYLKVLRASELFLIRAEALAQENRLTDAVRDLDSLRKRAGLELLANTRPGIGKTALLEAVYHERQVELFTELGHRWFDLKRTGRASTVLSPLKPEWTADAVLYPIPEGDRLLNPNLDQNNGYY